MSRNKPNSEPRSGKTKTTSEKATPPPKVIAPKKDRGLIGKTILGKYKIISSIAKGGMGQIYKAEQQPLGRHVAIKVMHAIDNDNLEKRFFLEASIHARLEHPNTVRIYDYGRTEDNLVFIVMELLNGHTLKAEIDHGPIDAGRIVNLAIQICGALHEAHQNEIVHRDIKPSNIFLIQHEKTFAKLIDFGLVKSLNQSSSLSQTGMIMGSPMYMAPEQIEGKPIDPRTDIYGLGMSLYQALCGTAPFSGELNQVLMAHIVKMPAPFNTYLSEEAINKNLEWIIFKSIQKDPNDRFESIHQMRKALQLCAEAINKQTECSLEIIDNQVLSKPGTQAELAELAQSEFSKNTVSNDMADTISPTFRSTEKSVPSWFPTFLAVCAVVILFSGGIMGGIYLYKEINADQFSPSTQPQKSSQIPASVHEHTDDSPQDTSKGQVEEKPITVSIHTSKTAKAYLSLKGKRSKKPICNTTPCTIDINPNEVTQIVLIRRGYESETIDLNGKIQRIDVEMKRKKSSKTKKTDTIDGPLTPEIYKSD